MESSKNASQQILLKRQSSLVLRFLISTSPTPRALCARSQRSQHRSGEARLSHQEPILVKDVGLTDQQTILRNAERTTKGPAAHGDARGSDSKDKDWITASEG